MISHPPCPNPSLGKQMEKTKEKSKVKNNSLKMSSSIDPHVLIWKVLQDLLSERYQKLVTQ
jgi:hypothetical protein